MRASNVQVGVNASGIGQSAYLIRCIITQHGIELNPTLTTHSLCLKSCQSLTLHLCEFRQSSPGMKSAIASCQRCMCCSLRQGLCLV